MAETETKKVIKIITPEAAAMMDGIFSELLARWQETADNLKESETARAEEAKADAERTKDFERQLRERDLKIDDLERREHKLSEELRLEVVEGEAMRGELRHLRSTVNAAADRVENAVMRDVEDRHARSNGKGRTADVAAIEEALLKTAESENKKNAPQRLDARPVRQPTKIPDNLDDEGQR